MLKLDKIHRKIGNFSLNNIHLEVDEGDYFMLLGNSGAGKTILLEIIAGLVNPDSGLVYIDGENITQTDIHKRGVGLVYQDQSLFPHLSVYDNIAYPLKSKGENKEKIKQQVERLATDTEILHLLKRNPATLSGGEIQRVAIARTLASKPKVLLLDEPLSSLDVQLKKEMSALLRKINRKGQTIVHVTHDYEEAISLANKIGIIENNTIIQVGSPYEVFHHPQSKFVASFIGIKNFYRGEIISKELKDSLKVFQTGNVQILISSEEAKSFGHISFLAKVLPFL